MSGNFHTVVTSAISHTSLMHLGANMLVTYFVGRELLAGGLSRRSFLLCYAASGLVGGVAQLAYQYYEDQRQRQLKARFGVHSRWGADEPRSAAVQRFLGASGCVNGAVMTFCTLYPRSLVYVYFVLPVPAALLGGLYVAYDVYSATYRQNTGVGHVAHVGGALTGLAFGMALRYGLLRRFL